MDFKASITLEDMASPIEEIEISIEGGNECIVITPAGHDQHRPPIYIDFYRGEVSVFVYADINQEDPTHIISLKGAREEYREQD